MIILEKGQLPKEKRYLKRCRWCKTVFIYKESEVKLYGYWEDFYRGIECPICSAKLHTSMFDRRVKIMGLDKAIASGKEHRVQYGTKDQPYCKSVDKTCRNHGGCPWCEGNRTYNSRKRLEASKDKEKDI